MVSYWHSIKPSPYSRLVLAIRLILYWFRMLSRSSDRRESMWHERRESLSTLLSFQSPLVYVFSEITPRRVWVMLPKSYRSLLSHFQNFELVPHPRSSDLFPTNNLPYLNHYVVMLTTELFLLISVMIYPRNQSIIVSHSATLICDQAFSLKE